MARPYPYWLHEPRLLLSGWRDREGKFHFDPEGKHPLISVSYAEARRRLVNIDRFVSPDRIYEMIVKAPIWKYKTNIEFYTKRDRALLSLLYLLGCRVSEVIRLKKSQFDFGDPDFIIIRDFRISKRKRKTIEREGIPRIDFPIPKRGRFAKFTKLVLDYYNIADEEMFKIGRIRAWQIVKYMTGKWCHYFRCQRLSYLVNLFRSATVTARIVGIKNPQTIAHYYRGSWEQFREELKT